jgi:hypothetical protein
MFIDFLTGLYTHLKYGSFYDAHNQKEYRFKLSVARQIMWLHRSQSLFAIPINKQSGHLIPNYTLTVQRNTSKIVGGESEQGIILFQGVYTGK